MYKNRTEAAQHLVKKLEAYRNMKNATVVTIPRGGLPIGYVLATALNLPLDIVLSKKIGHPFNKEFAIGAVTLSDSILSDSAKEISEIYLKDEAEQIRTLLKQRQDFYYGDNKPTSFKDKTVIIVDDGVATGHTLISSIKLIEKQNPNQIIVALPVSPPSVIKTIEAMPLVTKTICLLTPTNFLSVGQFYKDFSPIDDDEVVYLLKKANNEFKRLAKKATS